MKIVVQRCQVIDNEEVFNCETLYNSIEDFRAAIAEIIYNWSNMHGSDNISTCPIQLKVGLKIILTCAYDVETFMIKDIIFS